MEGSRSSRALVAGGAQALADRGEMVFAQEAAPPGGVDRLFDQAGAQVGFDPIEDGAERADHGDALVDGLILALEVAAMEDGDRLEAAQAAMREAMEAGEELVEED